MRSRSDVGIRSVWSVWTKRILRNNRSIRTVRRAKIDNTNRFMERKGLGKRLRDEQFLWYPV